MYTPGQRVKSASDCRLVSWENRTLGPLRILAPIRPDLHKVGLELADVYASTDVASKLTLDDVFCHKSDVVENPSCLLLSLFLLLRSRL